MYLLEEITRQHQNERLQEAALARIVKSAKTNKSSVISTIRNRTGNLLINYGLKLKGHQLPNNHVHRPVFVTRQKRVGYYKSKRENKLT